MLAPLSSAQKKALLTDAVKSWREYVAQFSFTSLSVAVPINGLTDAVVCIKDRETRLDATVVMTGEGRHPEVYKVSGNKRVLKKIEDIFTYYLTPEKQKGRLDGAAAVTLLSDGPQGMASLCVEEYLSRIEDPRIRMLLPVDGLKKEFGQMLERAGLSRIVDGLNQDALAIMRYSADASWTAYSFYAEPGEKGVIRRQAAESYPLLSTQISQRLSLRRAVDNQQSLQPGLRNLIGMNEKGESAISKGLLKRLVGVKWPHNDIMPQNLLKHLSQISPDWFPKDEVNWNAFCDIAKTVLTILPETTGNSHETLLAGCGGNWEDLRYRLGRAYAETRPPEGTDEEVFAYFKAKLPWKTFEKLKGDKLDAYVDETVAGLTDLPVQVAADDVRSWLKGMYNPPCTKEVLEGACYDVLDAIKLFSDKVAMPLISRESRIGNIIATPSFMIDSERAVAGILFRGVNAVAILETTRHIHSQIANLEEAGVYKPQDAKAEAIEKRQQEEQAWRQSTLLRLRNHEPTPTEDEWPSLTEIVEAPNGIYIVPLTTAAHLKDEGKFLSHCVGGYSSKCSQNGHHIISMRCLDDTGLAQSLSTAEIGAISRGVELCVRQHRGKKNSVPEARANEAFEWYKDEIDSGRMTVNYDGIKNFIATRSNRLSTVELLCGYDWNRKALCEQAVYPWRQRYLPKKLRKLTVEQLQKLPEIVEVSRKLNPAYDRIQREIAAREKAQLHEAEPGDTEVEAPRPRM